MIELKESIFCLPFAHKISNQMESLARAMNFSTFLMLYMFNFHHVQVELQSHGTVDVREKDAIFNYRRKYLPTRQVV